MIKSNCHTHTVFCDGKNTAEEMVLSAIEKNFTSLGFSCHSPMNYDNVWAIKKNDVSEYINEIRTLKEKYKGKLDILCGIEVDSDFCDVDLRDFEYTIASVHQFQNKGKIYPIDLSPEDLKKAADELFAGNTNLMSCCYFKSVADFICSGDFDVVGHFDLITKFNEKTKLLDEDDENYRTAAIDAVDRILLHKKDIIFEVNTGAMYRCSNKKPYPAPFIMEHLFRKRAKITVTTDAHNTQSLDFAMDKAAEYIKSFGFDKVHILTNEGFKEVCI